MGGADITLSTESQLGSEGCSPYSVQCLATHLCYAKGQAVCILLGLHPCARMLSFLKIFFCVITVGTTVWLSLQKTLRESVRSDRQCSAS